MKIGIAEFTCVNGHVFEAPELAPEVYGFLLLRSANNFMAFLNAIEDPTFDEVRSLIKTSSHRRHLRGIDRSGILHRIFGELACDTDPKGSVFVIDMPPTCHACGSQEIAAWDFKDPPEIADIDVPHVTHEYWNSLTPEQKKERAERLIAALKT